MYKLSITGRVSAKLKCIEAQLTTYIIYILPIPKMAENICATEPSALTMRKFYL